MSEQINGIVIRRYRHEDCDEVCRLANEGFGEGYLSHQVTEALNQTADGMFFVAVNDGAVVGYCVFVESTARQVAQDMQLELESVLEISGGRERVCLTKSMTVDPGMGRRGIAGALFAHGLERAEGLGFTSAWGSAWVVDGMIPMDRIFTTNGFLQYGPRSMLWYGQQGYHCRVCGGPCRCNGMIYYKQL